jgi:phosphopantetheinyl transferase
MPETKPENICPIDNAQLLIWEITESIDELKNQLSLLDMTELKKKVSDKRKLEFLGVRVALKHLLGYEVTVKYDVEGKPFLADDSFHISVSHSGKWIAVTAHPTRAVGIDIEVPTDKIQKLYTRFLSETEQRELSDGQNIQQLQIAWSAKEALYKIIGKEAVDFAKQLRIYPFEVSENGEIRAEHIPSKQQFTLYYHQQSSYTLVYCTE